MKERPIIFTGESVKAIVDSRKTQTRRPVKGKWIPLVEEVLEINGKWVFTTIEYDLSTPFGIPGERLWVRETVCFVHPVDNCKATYDGARIVDDPRLDDQKTELWYRADGEMGLAHRTGDNGLYWTPSIHMPRWASRITLEITDVRVERVQDISEDDAQKEIGKFRYQGNWPNNNPGFKPYKFDFKHKWNSIYAKRGFGWDTNPFVWCIEFKRIDR